MLSGQAGSTRERLTYESTSDVVLAGLVVKPSSKFGLDFQLAWNTNDAALQHFDYFVDPALMNPNQSYDFTRTPENSDLEVDQLEASLGLDYYFKESFWISGKYRWIDVDDGAPYLQDYSGEISWYALSLGWQF